MMIKEVLKRTGLSRITLYRWESDGRIPKVPRDFKNARVYSEEDVQRILDIKKEVTYR